MGRRNNSSKIDDYKLMEEDTGVFLHWSDIRNLNVAIKLAYSYLSNPNLKARGSDTVIILHRRIDACASKLENMGGYTEYGKVEKRKKAEIAKNCPKMKSTRYWVIIHKYYNIDRVIPIDGNGVGKFDCGEIEPRDP